MPEAVIDIQGANAISSALESWALLAPRLPSHRRWAASCCSQRLLSDLDRTRRQALAAGVTVLLVFLPPIVPILVADKKPWQHYPGVVLDYLTPAGYTSHYQGIAWADLPPSSNPRMNPRFRQRPVVDCVAARKRLFTNLS